MLSPREFVIICFGLPLIIACAPAEQLDSQMLAYRQQWLLEKEPTDPQETLDAVEGAKSDPSVTVFGRIANADSFEPGKASFVLSYDSLSKEHAHADPDDCPFCRRKKNSVGANAIVRFLDSEGNVIAADMRSVLGLKDGQNVIVCGKGEVDPQGILFIAATGVFVRK
jgi:hypothetical protein